MSDVLLWIEDGSRAEDGFDIFENLALYFRISSSMSMWAGSTPRENDHSCTGCIAGALHPNTVKRTQETPNPTGATEFAACVTSSRDHHLGSFTIGQNMYSFKCNWSVFV